MAARACGAFATKSASMSFVARNGTRKWTGSSPWGEIHKERKSRAIDRPRWLTIPRRALFTGIGIFGAVGSGKPTCCIYPFAEQLLAYRRDDPERRIGVDD